MNNFAEQISRKLQSERESFREARNADIGQHTSLGLQLGATMGVSSPLGQMVVPIQDCLRRELGADTF